MNTNKLVSVLAVLSVSFVVFFAAVARADTFTVRPIAISRTTVNQAALGTEIGRRARTVLGYTPLVLVSGERTGDVTSLTVTIEADQLSQRDEIRLEREISAALRSRTVVIPVRFFPTRAKH